MASNVAIQALIEGGPTDEFIAAVNKAQRAVGGLDEDFTSLTRAQRTQQNTLNRTARELRVLTMQLEDVEKGTPEFNRLTRAITRTNAQFIKARSRLDDIEGRLQRVQAAGGRAEKSIRRLAGVRLEGLRTKLIGIATAFISVQTVQQTRQEFERLNQVLRDAPQLDFGQARQLLRASELIGFDEGSIADIANEFNIRLGEAITDPESRKEFTDAISAIGLDLNALQAQAPTQQIQTLTEALRGVNDVASRSALADFIAGGQGGQALNFLAANADAARLAFTELNRTPVITPDTQKRLAQFNADTARLGHSVADARNALVASAQPAVSAFTDVVSGASRAIAEWAQENRGAALGIGAIVAVAPTAISALADIGGGALENAANFALLTGRVSGVAGVLPAIAKAGAIGKAGFLALAGGIKTATAASLAFAVTPVGLTIIGISAAVAALTAGVVYLADKVGGFGNLASIAFAGAKAAALTFAQTTTLSLRPIAKVIDAIIAAISRIKTALGGSAIEFRVGDAFKALDEAASNARADVARQYRAGVAEGERQQAAGTSVGQRIGGAFGFGGEAAAAGTSAPAPAVSAPSVTNAPVNNQSVNITINVESLNADDPASVDTFARQLAAAIGR